MRTIIVEQQRRARLARPGGQWITVQIRRGNGRYHHRRSDAGTILTMNREEWQQHEIRVRFMRRKKMDRKALRAKKKLTTPEKPACVRNADQIRKKGTRENRRSKDAASDSANCSSGKPKSDMDLSAFVSSFEDIFGGAPPQFGLPLLRQAAHSVFRYERDPEEHTNYVLAALREVRPRDPLEALLLVQMLGVHNLSTEFIRRAALSNQSPEGADLAVNWCTKLNRTFVAQMEVLMRYRSQGQQKVIVEHVHVNQGGQALVGVVNRTNNQDDDKSGG